MKRFCLLLLSFTFIIDALQSAEKIDKDSTNFIDAIGKKQGYWILLGKNLHKPEYADDQKIEEGQYTDSKKNGIWQAFFPNNKLKSKIPYIDNKPEGYAILYHENGNIKEQGEWSNNRWVGDYKLYYENGKVQQNFKFNTFGKREGSQVYYNENGQKIIEGTWAEGKEAGILKEYYDNGDLKAEKNFNNGSLDLASVKTFSSKKAAVVIVKKVEEPIAPPVILKEEKDNLGKTFNGEGYWKLYNSNKQVSKDGVFSKNRLIDGKVFTYKDGILIRVAVYKDGRYTGDSIIEE